MLHRTLQVGALACALAGSVAVSLVLATDGPAAAASPRTVSAKYSCTASVPGSTLSYSGSIQFSGSTPTTVVPGGTVAMSGFQVHVTIPGTLVDEALKFGDAISGTGTVIDVNATDAVKKTVNAAGKGIVIPTTKLVANKAITVSLPAKAISVGSWTASASGVMKFKTGKVVLAMMAGTSKVSLTCSAKPPATINTTAVS